MTRTEAIAKFKLWRVYLDANPGTALCEGSKTACLRYIGEHRLRRDYKHGRVRLGQIIWEEPKPDLFTTKAR
jgi:hypothetical protein